MRPFIKLIVLTFALFMFSCSEQDDFISPEPIEEPERVESSPRILFSYNISDGINNSVSILIDDEGRVLRLSGDLTRMNQGKYVPDILLKQWKNSAEPIEGIQINIEELTTQFNSLENAEKLVYRSNLEEEGSSFITSMYGYYLFSYDTNSNTSSTSGCACNVVTYDINQMNSSAISFRPILLEQTSELLITQTNESTTEINDWFKIIAEDLIDFSQFSDPK